MTALTTVGENKSEGRGLMQRSFLKALLCAAGALVLAGAAFAQDKIGRAHV